MWLRRYPRSSDPHVQSAQRDAARFRAVAGAVAVAGLLGVALLTSLPAPPADQQTAETVSAAASPDVPA